MTDPVLGGSGGVSINNRSPIHLELAPSLG